MFFSRFFEPKPFATDYLPADNGHRVFYQQFGNPQGEPILSFHGGPGSYTKAKHASGFDLKKYRVILFDQRGCGQSTPAGSIEHNTTTDLIHDAMRILDHLHIDKAHIKGGSWGSTLALLFAQQYPQRVTSLIVSQIFLGRRADYMWLNAESRMFYPDIFAQMEEQIPAGQSVRDGFTQMVFSSNPLQQIKATQFLGQYERLVGSLDPAFKPEIPDDAHMQAFRIYMHYDRQNFGLIENQILDGIATITHIPTLIVHNRLDMVCPVEQAWLLHQALPQSRLVIVPDHGHSSPLLYKTLARETTSFLSNLTL
jgi:proline iminopeptidase